jgi:hypothetical protein
MIDPQYLIAVTGFVDFIEGKPRYLRVADVERAYAMPAKITRTIRRYIMGEPDKSLDLEGVGYTWDKLSAAVKAFDPTDTDAMEKLIDGLPNSEELVGGYVGAMQRVVNYVTDQMPASAAASLAGIRPRDPSLADQSRWRRKVDLAEDPLYALQWLAEGRLTTGAVECLQAIYPAILAQMVSAAMSALADAALSKSWNLPGDRSRQLTLILGRDKDAPVKQPDIAAATDAAKAKTKPPSDATNNKVSQAFGPANPNPDH